MVRTELMWLLSPACSKLWCPASIPAAICTALLVDALHKHYVLQVYELLDTAPFL